MTSPDDFTSYAHLADELIEQATKDQLAEAVRLLALNIGYYHERYGDVPQDTLLKMVRAETLDEDSKRLLLHGMQDLLSALAEVMGFDYEEAHGTMNKTNVSSVTTIAALMLSLCGGSVSAEKAFDFGEFEYEASCARAATASRARAMGRWHSSSWRSPRT